MRGTRPEERAGCVVRNAPDYKEDHKSIGLMLARCPWRKGVAMDPLAKNFDVLVFT